MTESSLTLKPQKIAIIGSGKVGTTFAYALLLSGRVGEIVLIDMDKQRTEGEVMDLNDAVPLSHPTRITQGDYPDCAGADIVVIAAGASEFLSKMITSPLKLSETIRKILLARRVNEERS